MPSRERSHDLEPWRDELERHRIDPLAHPPQQVTLRQESQLREQAAHHDIWKALDSIRREVMINTRYRYLLTGAFAVLSLEASAIAGAFVFHVLH